MRGSMLRQTLLTNNLANADTPGYRRLIDGAHTGRGQGQRCRFRPAGRRPATEGRGEAGAAVDVGPHACGWRGAEEPRRTQVVLDRLERPLGPMDLEARLRHYHGSGLGSPGGGWKLMITRPGFETGSSVTRSNCPG